MIPEPLADRANIPASPFVGLAPYGAEDAPFFFGREEEERIVRTNLIASRLTVLYGPSGTGKSSLLRAGVANRLHENALAKIRRGTQPDGVVVVFRSWRGDIASALAADAATAVAGLTGETLAVGEGLLATLQMAADSVGAYVFVILDQFEEYFLYHPEDGAFADDFTRAVIARDLPVNFLISLREDALAKLDRFKGRIPSLFDNTLRIDHLEPEPASQAIVGSVQAYNRLVPAAAGVAVEEGLLDAVLEQITAGRIVLGGVSDPGGIRARVELPFLQLVMLRLWTIEAAQGSRVLRLETLERLGGSERIVGGYLDDTMEELPPDQQDIAANILRFLVTPSGTKVAFAARDLAAYADVAEEEVRRVLAHLSSGAARILRPVTPGAGENEPSYEIFHDVLAPAILDWRRRHETEARLAQIVGERRRSRRLRALAVAFAVLFVALLIVTIFALLTR